MEMLIDDMVYLAEIQKEFTKEFNFLKLEFYEKDTHAKTNSLKLNHLIPEIRIGDCSRERRADHLSIKRTQTVAEIEEYLLQALGLTVRVFRKSGNLWIETRLSSSWTLEKQELIGGELSSNKNNDNSVIN